MGYTSSESGESRSGIFGALSPMRKLTWVPLEEKCVALRKKEHVKETYTLLSPLIAFFTVVFSFESRKQKG